MVNSPGGNIQQTFDGLDGWVWLRLNSHEKIRSFVGEGGNLMGRGALGSPKMDTPITWDVGCNRGWQVGRVYGQEIPKLPRNVSFDLGGHC